MYSRPLFVVEVHLTFLPVLQLRQLFLVFMGDLFSILAKKPLPGEKLVETSLPNREYYQDWYKEIRADADEVLLQSKQNLNCLCEKEDTLQDPFGLIEQDIPRTAPQDVIKFDAPITRILNTYAVLSRSPGFCGYTQGMSGIVKGFLLSFFDTDIVSDADVDIAKDDLEQAEAFTFFLFQKFMRRFGNHYMVHSRFMDKVTEGKSSDNEHFENLEDLIRCIKKYYPRLHDRLTILSSNMDLPLNQYLGPIAVLWFGSMFTQALDSDHCAPIWDEFFRAKNPKVFVSALIICLLEVAVSRIDRHDECSMRRVKKLDGVTQKDIEKAIEHAKLTTRLRSGSKKSKKHANGKARRRKRRETFEDTISREVVDATTFLC